jgi:hypothetical protein
MEQDTRPVQVKDIRVGDLIDLQGDSALGHHPLTEYEFMEVIEIEKESPDCIVLYFNGMAAGYESNQVMMVANLS